MKDSNDDVFHLSDILIALGKIVLTMVALMLCMRFPVIWIKIPLMVAVLYFCWRWLFKPAKKKPVQVEESLQRPKEIEPPKPSRKKRQPFVVKQDGRAGQAPKPDSTAVRQLIAYDAAGEFGQAKALIQYLNGKVFPEPDGKEFAVLAGNYFPVKLEPADDGVRFVLD